jgi:hypothetical protein
MERTKPNIDRAVSAKTRKCVTLSNEEFEFEPTKENPDEECINCILDDILSKQEGEMRDFWIGIYEKGLMKLNCSKTRKSYIITKEFFDKINPKEPCL